MNLALLLFLAGAALIAVGIWWIYPPASLIAAGILLLLVALLFGLTKPVKN